MSLNVVIIPNLRGHSNQEAREKTEMASDQVHVPNNCGFHALHVCSWQDMTKRVFLVWELLFWVHVKAWGSGTRLFVIICDPSAHRFLWHGYLGDASSHFTTEGQRLSHKS